MIFLRSFIILSFIIFIVDAEALAQDTEDYEYTSEFIWGINKNTNSGLIGGLMVKYSKAITPRMFQTFGVEVVNVKHPKEQRYPSYTGNYFIFGKSNYLYSVRGQYGREWLVFKKAPQQGIQINAILAAGPTIGVVAPYFVEVAVDRGESVNEQYNPNVHDYSQILGTGNILQGIGKSSLNIGGNIKSSIIFEFGTFKNNVTGFEAGFLLEGFPKDVVLIPQAENRNIFTSAFITLFYGSRR
ncbi:hypothetical protein BH23BAC1_BH23BAC1_21320 [soil metagenome]